MKKWILGSLLALVIIMAVVIVAIGLSLDTTIKKGVETFGPQITKVDVKLADVSLSLLSGFGSIKGLVIGNPEGYKLPHAISVGSSSVAIRPGSLFTDKVVVKSIRVEGPEIFLELGPGGSNLQRIQANLGSGASSGQKPSKAPGAANPGKKLQVDEVVVTGGKITLAAAMLGGKLTEAPLPEIRLTNLGAGPEGISAADLGMQILSAVMEGAIKVSGDSLTKAGKEAVANATKGANEALNKAAGDATGKAAKGIGDLLNKKK
ncbi:MAG: AsmA family protein [Verrucomicrobiota bacterium]